MCQSLCVTADSFWAPEKAGNSRHCAYTLMLTHNGSFPKEKRLQENWVVFLINFPFTDEGRVLEREGRSLESGEQCLRASVTEGPL